VDVKLIVFRPDGTRKDIPLKPGRHVIGRNSTASVRVPLPMVSREHCEVVIEGGKLRVRDLNSSNGTFRNQQKVTETELTAGDVLSLGTFQMTVQINGKPATIAPPLGADAFAETPPAGSKALPADAEDTVTKASPSSAPAKAGAKRPEDSSVFDFDFDFEDDENPKL
jgi:pSer/pThr/pTyr-binding forkhead associated (FHA) protein